MRTWYDIATGLCIFNIFNALYFAAIHIILYIETQCSVNIPFIVIYIVLCAFWVFLAFIRIRKRQR